MGTERDFVRGRRRFSQNHRACSHLKSRLNRCGGIAGSLESAIAYKGTRATRHPCHRIGTTKRVGETSACSCPVERERWRQWRQRASTCSSEHFNKEVGARDRFACGIEECEDVLRSRVMRVEEELSLPVSGARRQ